MPNYYSKNPKGLKRSSLFSFFLFFFLSVCCQPFFQALRVSALTFGKWGLLITACWLLVKSLQLVSKTSKVLEAQEHNTSYFQISFTSISAVLGKREIVAKFFSYPLTPILYVLCLFSQVREQKLLLLTHLLVPAVQTKGCTLSQTISSHPFLLYV